MGPLCSDTGQPERYSERVSGTHLNSNPATLARRDVDCRVAALARKLRRHRLLAITEWVSCAARIKSGDAKAHYQLIGGARLDIYCLPFAFAMIGLL